MFEILSPMRICEDANFEWVNCHYCTTVRPATRAAKSFEVYLNGADGMDWRTAVRCNLIYQFDKAEAGTRRGLVTIPRRKEIARVMHTSLQLPT